MNRQEILHKLRESEYQKIGEVKFLVSCVRNIRETNLSINTAAQVLHLDCDEITNILSLIDTHPEMDDEDIAEIYINLTDY